MSNPPVPAGPVTFPDGPGQTTDNLTALPNNTALGLGKVGTALTQYFDALVAPISFLTTSGAVSGDTVSLYLVISEDGTHWTAGIDPTSTSNQASKLTGHQPLQTITVGAGAATYFFDEFSIDTALGGFMPTFFSVVISNQSGAALNATPSNFYAQYNLVAYP